MHVHFFEKFELTLSAADDPCGGMSEFRDSPKFFLEFILNTDKKPFYDFISDWMDREDLLHEFDVDDCV